uniref:Globin domain-containing protein n=1 Tax=Leptobrachium leishanense TaxID=445787 RepID=A0A8C5Q9R8_9ANUR
MALTADDKKQVKNIWSHIAPNAETWGSEALDRMFKSELQTTTYFSKYDLHTGSPHLKSHGKKVMDALTEAVNHLDNIPGALSKLSDLHAYELRVDPGNFPLLAHCILVVLAIHLPKKLDVCTHQALDKFLAAVACALTSKYR